MTSLRQTAGHKMAALTVRFSQISQIFAARLVLLAPRHHHATPLLEKLHWLPISERIKYKVACMCFSAINGSGPAYLSGGGGGGGGRG